MNKYKKGFTLIELLVVVAIISLLASIVMASLNSARTKAKDAARVETFSQIRTALELYYDTNGSFTALNCEPDACNIPPYEDEGTARFTLDLGDLLNLSTAEMGGEPSSSDLIMTDSATGQYFMYFTPSSVSNVKNVGCGANYVADTYCLGNY